MAQCVARESRDKSALPPWRRPWRLTFSLVTIHNIASKTKSERNEESAPQSAVQSVGCSSCSTVASAAGEGRSHSGRRQTGGEHVGATRGDVRDSSAGYGGVCLPHPSRCRSPPWGGPFYQQYFHTCGCAPAPVVRPRPRRQPPAT